MVVHACDLRTYKIGTGGSGVQNHFQLHRKLKAKLGYMRPWLKTTTKKKYITTFVPEPSTTVKT